MSKPNVSDDLEKYVCLVCDEPFYLAFKDTLTCPKCGNKDEQSFAPAEVEEADDTSKEPHVFHEAL